MRNAWKGCFSIVFKFQVQLESFTWVTQYWDSLLTKELSKTKSAGKILKIEIFYCQLLEEE